MKIIIAGKGWLGTMIRDYLVNKDHTVNLVATDITFEREWSEALPYYDVCINTAAKTNIDFCEKSKVFAHRSNIHGAQRLATLCRRYNVKYVFLSSACIFESKDKDDIKYEDNSPNPQCFYAKTKMMAEELIMDINHDSLIVRLRLPISEVPHPRNTLTKLLGYSLINDNQESVTVVEDMLPSLEKLIEKKAVGIFHLINEGTVSPAEMAEALGHKFKIISKKEQDERMAREGKAKRVTAYIGSKKIPMLPDIRKRLPEIAKKYKSHLS